MKKFEMTMATSHKDLQGEILTEEALQSGVRDFSKYYLPINVNHDIRNPPIGRVVSAKVVKLPDGESALVGIGEIYENNDNVESLKGDGRRLRVCESEIKTISVSYDRSFKKGQDGQRLIEELSEISGERPIYSIKKAMDPVTILTIAAGIFIIGSIADGFFKKMGADMYDKLKSTLKNYYHKPESSKDILDFRFSIRRNEKISDVHVLIQNPFEQEITDFFDKNLSVLDSIVESIMKQPNIDIAELVLESKGQEISIRYAVTGDVIPLVPKSENRASIDNCAEKEKKNDVSMANT